MSTAAEIFRDTPLYSDGILYTMVTLPSSGVLAAVALLAEIRDPFLACIVDKDEVTLVLPMMAWEDFSKRLPGARQEGSFRLITFDMPLDFDVVGFMAHISAILANASISIMALAAFSRDHILVPADEFETAWNTLETAKGQHK
ncbi:MAG: hypothetical protein CUN55_12605 [Phototrophicales bacterium]|nr:MAG: hypothetical protein CUN55_12605 [Phototrophicales bacterium]